MKENLNKKILVWSYCKIVAVCPVHFPTLPLHCNTVKQMVC